MGVDWSNHKVQVTPELVANLRAGALRAMKHTTGGNGIVFEMVELTPFTVLALLDAIHHDR